MVATGSGTDLFERFFIRAPQLNGVTGTVLFGLATYGMARAKPGGT